MGDYGNVGINAGYARFGNTGYGKAGLEGTVKGDFHNPNNGYKLSGNASALIGNGHGVNAGAYAGVEFGKLNCSQFNLGLMADYTQSFKEQKLGTLNQEDGKLVFTDNLDPKESLKAGLELGYSKNICCDEDRRFSISMMGGADFHDKVEINPEKQTLEQQRLKNIKPFIGSRAEYAKKINDKGQELYFSGKCFLSDGSSYGEAGIGFRF